MGRLRDLQTGEEHPLRAVHAVGRAETADLRLPEAQVSSCHAMIRYERGGWTLRDLGATNGTRVDGRAAPTGVSLPLATGARLAFGGLPPRFELASEAPPAPFAQATDGAWVEGTEAELAVPELPPIRFDSDLGWHLRAPDGPEPVFDGQLVDAAGRTWRLSLPSMAPTTTARRLRLRTCDLIFEVSGDEEFARLILSHEGGVIELAPRAFHYHLLVLARLRRDDHDAARDDQRGWTEVEDVCKRLACTRNQLHVYLYRARRQLEEAGFIDAADIVERRGTTGPIRFGVEQFEERRV